MLACDVFGDGAPQRADCAAGGAGASPNAAAGASPNAAAGVSVLQTLKRVGGTVGAVLTSPLVAPVYPALVLAAGFYLAAGNLGDRHVVAAQTLGHALSDGAVAAAHVHAQTLWDGSEEPADVGGGAVAALAALGLAARHAARRLASWRSQ